MKNMKWFKKKLDDIEVNTTSLQKHDAIWMLNRVHELIDQLDEPEVLSWEWIDKHKYRYDNVELVGVKDLQNLLVPKQKLVEENKRLNGLLITMQEEIDQAYRKGFKEGERQTAEYFESITEEPSKEQVWKYLSEHGIKIADKEPETVADVVTTFWKSYERLKEVMSMEVEEMEE